MTLSLLEKDVAHAATAFFVEYNIHEELKNNEARFNIADLCNVSGLSEQQVATGIKGLIKKKLVEKAEESDFRFTGAGINKFHDLPPFDKTGTRSTATPRERPVLQTEARRVVNGTPEQLIDALRKHAMKFPPKTAKSRRWDLIHLWDDDTIKGIIAEHSLNTPTKLIKHFDKVLDEYRDKHNPPL